MIATIKSIEELNTTNNFIHQNESFKEWCKENQGKKFYVVKDYGNVLRLKNLNFLITRDYLELKE